MPSPNLLTVFACSATTLPEFVDDSTLCKATLPLIVTFKKTLTAEDFHPSAAAKAFMRNSHRAKQKQHAW